jgi:hypothetical protein
MPRAGSYVTVDQLARRCKVHRATIWRWVAKGLVDVQRLEPRTGVRVRLRPRIDNGASRA